MSMMSADRNRLHLISEHLETLAAECRALEADAAIGRAFMADTAPGMDATAYTPEDLADVGRRMTTGALLTGPNLLLWRNIRRHHRCVRITEE